MPPRWRARIRTTELELSRVAQDASPVRGRPWGRLRPRNESELASIVRWAARARVPLTVRGGGTSLDGESSPVRGGVVVDLSGWDRVLEVSEADRWARVQPGVINYDLQRRLARHGCFYPPNPGSWESSTLGGNAGTNASGFRSFRYGPTRAWVLRARAVLGTGERITLGSLAWKRSAGPDLLPLLIGSEGTLGIFTELTVRIVPRPRTRVGLLAAVSRTCSLGEVAQELQDWKGEGLVAVEWVDAQVAQALAEGSRTPLPAGAGGLVLVEVESASREGRPWVEAWSRRLLRSGLSAPVVPFPDADQLWRERGRAGHLLDERVGPRVREDVAVPLSAWDELLRRVRVLAHREGIPLLLYAHLGEGSLHPNFLVDPASLTAARLRQGLWQIAWELGGTASAEHGLGVQKAPVFAREHGDVPVRVMRALKREMDPAGILNPGKFFG